MADFPEQLPHGEIKELSPDVFFVMGQSKFAVEGNVAQFTRSMTIVRDGSDLTLVNTLRLDDDGLRALEQLGTVKNIVRIAANHGRDDAFYSDRYDAPVWALNGAPQERPVNKTATLNSGDGSPITDASVVAFQSIAAPEAVLHLKRNGGIIVSGDSLQNVTGPDEFFSAPTIELFKKGGFFKRGNIGPAWRARLQPAKTDFDDILALPFKHLLPAHGEALLDDAHQVLSETVEDVYSA